jgi:hypothetical protein
VCIKIYLQCGSTKIVNQLARYKTHTEFEQHLADCDVRSLMNELKTEYKEHRVIGIN